MSGIRLEDYIARQPPEIRARIEREYHKLRQQVEDRQAIQTLIEQSGTSPATQIEGTLHTLPKLERRTELAVRALRRFAALLGGEVAITIRFPDHPPIQLVSPSDDARSTVVADRSELPTGQKT